MTYNKVNQKPVNTLRPITKSEFVENFVVLKMNKDGQFKNCIMDTDGKIIYEDGDIHLTKFNEFGLAIASNEKHKVGIMDMKGKIVVPINYENLNMYMDKLVIKYSIVSNNINDDELYLKGFMDFDGNIILAANYQDAIYINENRVFVKEKGIWRIVDLAGNTYKVLQNITYLKNAGDGLIAFTTSEKDTKYSWASY